MDDQSPNPTAPQSNIDDLVKELSRPQGSTPPPAGGPVSSSVPNPAPRPTTPPVAMPSVPTMPPRPTTPPPIVPNSALPTPKTAPTPISPSLSPQTPAPKEYQSSIRTMSDDLTKLKAGQQPQGVNVPRKIDNTPPDPTKPVVPVAPAPIPARPSTTATLPSATKSPTLPTGPTNQPVQVPTPAPVPRPVMPTMPPASKAQPSKLDQKNQFYVPPTATKAPTGLDSRNIIFAGIALAAVLLGGLYWYFMIQGSGTDQVVESPIVTFTPRPTATPNPDVLSTVFTTRGGTIVLPSAGDPSVAFSNGISVQSSITPGTFTAISIVSGASSSAQVLTIPSLLNRFVASYPPALQTALGQNYKFLLYGQKEAFDSKGKPVTSALASSRLVMVSEIASSSASILQGWESTMSTNLSGVMAISPAKNNGPFMSTSYNGQSVRFKNFPYPDHSIDYALIKYNGKTYLIIAGSREAMFATVDAFNIPGK